jgi:uncharacterized protein YjbI with pentapeptide repeats
LTEQKDSRWGLRGKTFWNWLELLIVPVVLVVIGFLFTMQQDARQQEIENRRAESERELAEQRAQDEALQAYLDQMSTLLLEKNLRASEEGSEVRTLARARTLTVLERMEAERKREVVQFLAEAELVQSAGNGEPIIALSGADLYRAFLSGIDFSGASLHGANLSGADLQRADLSGADLRDVALLCDYRSRDRQCPDLSRADLTGADLSGALLGGAGFENAEGLTEAQLEEAKYVKGATMPNGQKYGEWLNDK